MSDKKGMPRTVRMLINHENSINEISSSENMTQAETLDVIIELGIKTWIFYHRNFTLRPRFTSTLRKMEEDKGDTL